MPVYQITSKLIFPNPLLAREDGLLAIGGDLNPERLLLAYDNGIFPWFDEHGVPFWFAPNPRFVLFPHKLRISKSVKQLINSKKFSITENTCFDDVIKECAISKRKQEAGTWISKNFVSAYIKLHKMKIAKSIEVWHQKKLVGGLYGLEINNCFFGESMFYKENNASKLAFHYLCNNNDYRVIDCQIYTEHFAKLGAEMIPLEKYLDIIGSDKD